MHRFYIFLAGRERERKEVMYVILKTVGGERVNAQVDLYTSQHDLLFSFRQLETLFFLYVTDRAVICILAKELI